jgi:hypothetical protein
MTRCGNRTDPRARNKTQGTKRKQREKSKRQKKKERQGQRERGSDDERAAERAEKTAAGDERERDAGRSVMTRPVARRCPKPSSIGVAPALASAIVGTGSSVRSGGPNAGRASHRRVALRRALRAPRDEPVGVRDERRGGIT